MLHEPFRVNEISSVEDGLALFDDDRRKTMVKHSWGQQADAGVVMVLVVPAKKVGGKSAGILNGTEPLRKARPILHGPELALRIRVVVGDVWAAVRFGDAQVAEQKSHGFGGHRGSAIGVDRERIGLDALFGTGVGK